MLLHHTNYPKCFLRTCCDPKRTSSLYETANLPYRFDNPGQFRGYGIERADKCNNVAYYTSNSEYGRFPPTVHTVPLKYYPYNYELSRSLIIARKRMLSLNYM